MSLPLIPFPCFRAIAQFCLPQQSRCRSQTKISTCLNDFRNAFFLGLFHKAKETHGLTQADIYVTTNTPSMPTSCLLHLHLFLFEGLRSTLWSHPYSTLSHCLQLGSLPWPDIFPLAEILLFIPKLSVKARRRFIMLSFFCSLLKQTEKAVLQCFIYGVYG